MALYGYNGGIDLWTAAPDSADSQEQLAERLDVARQNRRGQWKTVLTVVGRLCLLLGGVLVAILRALETWFLELQYLLYRYMTVGEYAHAPAAREVLRLPLTLSAGLAVMGGLLLAWLLWRRKER